MVWWWVLAAGAALLFAAIALDTITDWIEENQQIDSSYGEVIRTKLRDGDYRVVAGIFDTRGNCTAQQAWEGELEDDLSAQFHGRDTIRVEL